MMETSQSIDQVMKMRYGVFLAIIKNIYMSQLMQNPEWQEAYLKWQTTEAYKNGTIEKQTELDLEGLMSFQSGL